MTEKTLNLIHRAYVDAVEQSNNILEIVENLQNILAKISTIPNEDLSQFDAFLKGLHTSKMIRRKTFQLTNLVTDITFVIMYIVIWLNATKNMDIDINLTARRKSLETELSKLLYTSESNTIANIHDRFGLRGIILNNIPCTEANDILFSVSDYIIAILTRKNRNEYNLFLNWLEGNSEIDNFTKERIKFTLNLPFRMANYKDYVNNPKGNGYQSIHFVLVLEMFSDILPGAELEIQLRTFSMHQTAINGSASYDEYEANRRIEETAVFKIEDFSKVNVIGFTSYKNTDDIDGIHYAKVFVNRRISSTLVV